MDTQGQKPVWELRDEYIARRQAGESIDIQAFCDQPYLNTEDRQDLQEQLEEYEAIQEGLERLTVSHLSAAELWARIAPKLERRHLALSEAASWSATIRDSIRDWLQSLHLTALQAVEAGNYQTSGYGSLPVTILDAQAKSIETVEFALKTDVEVEPEGALVFAAEAPDDSYMDDEVVVSIADEEREFELCTVSVQANRCIDVLIDLSPLGQGIRVDKHMLRVALTRAISE